LRSPGNRCCVGWRNSVAAAYSGGSAGNRMLSDHFFLVS
jgi:hypothetical protein